MPAQQQVLPATTWKIRWRFASSLGLYDGSYEGGDARSAEGGQGGNGGGSRNDEEGRAAQEEVRDALDRLLASPPSMVYREAAIAVSESLLQVIRVRSRPAPRLCPAMEMTVTLGSLNLTLLHDNNVGSTTWDSVEGGHPFGGRSTLNGASRLASGGGGDPSHQGVGAGVGAGVATVRVGRTSLQLYQWSRAEDPFTIVSTQGSVGVRVHHLAHLSDVTLLEPLHVNAQARFAPYSDSPDVYVLRVTCYVSGRLQTKVTIPV